MLIYVRQGKSKPKLKPKKEREEYAAWLAKHGVTKKKKEKPSFEPWTYSLSAPHRSTGKLPASKSNMMGSTAAKPQKIYTGDKMIGIGTLHKSNAVPVFTQEEAEDMAKMRR